MINSLTGKRNLRIYLWGGLVFLLINLLLEFANNRDTFWERFVNHIWLLFYILINNIIFFEYSIHRIRLVRRMILISFFILVLHFIFYSFVLYLWRSLGIQLHLYNELRKPLSFLEGVFHLFPYAIFSIIFFGVLKHIYGFLMLRKTAQLLLLEKKEAELNFLKSQTNPHFLFNTLNNIYSLARDKSDLAQESVMRLSKIMRFMLYETNKDFIAIEQELKIMNDYISLEKLRYDETLQIQMNYEIENEHQLIPPLLLMPLIENAFKHGVSETRREPFINIRLTVNQHRLYFIVKNSIEKPSNDWQPKENIGLSNLRRQLELLYTEHNLSLTYNDSEFKAELKINLLSHA